MALQFDENDTIVVYGVGYAGKIISNYLLICKNILVDALMVSPGHKEADVYELYDRDGKPREIPIIELGAENYGKENTSILSTVVAGKEEILTQLKHAGYKKIYDINDITPYEDAYYAFYFDKKGIHMKDEVLNFGNTKVYNPLLYNQELRDSFYATIGDEIFPGVYGDYSLVIDGAYEWDDVCLKEGDYIVDAGANLGLFSCYAAQKGCTVYACEPGTKSIEMLNKQKELYSKEITIIPMGLSDQSGYADFYESDCCALDSIYMPRGNVKKTQIKIETLDNLVESGIITHIDYIKADIEGAERYMLKGAEKTLRTMAPKLSICTYHYKEDPQILEQIIKEANPNYVVVHKWRKLYAYVPQ